MDQRKQRADYHNQQGVSYANNKNYRKAIEEFKMALTFVENHHSYYFLGLAHQMQQKNLAAKDYYRKSLSVDPNFSMSHNNLGVLLLADKEFNEAIEHFEAALSVDPKNISAYVNGGNAYNEIKNWKKAEEYWKKALLLNDKIPEAYNNLGLSAFAQRKEEEAVEYLLKAIQADPAYPPPYMHLAVLYVRKNELHSAATHLEKYLKLAPANHEAYALLGNIYLNSGLYDEAKKCFYKALDLKPNFAYAINDLGNLYKHLGELETALEYYNKALFIDPSLAGTWNNVGVIHFARENYTEAIKAFKKAIEMNPDEATPYFHLGLIYEESNDPRKSAEYLTMAVTRDQKFFDAQAILVYALMKSCDWEEYAKQASFLDRITSMQIKEGVKISESPFTSIVRCDNQKTNYDVAHIMSKQILKTVKNIGSEFIHTVQPKKKIRIGYVSRDYYNHATSYLIRKMIQIHDRSKFEIFCYSYGPDVDDEYRKDIEKACDSFVNVRHLNHKEAAEKIYEDEIDILVDLKGFTQRSRLEIAAQRPAPIQISYLGFPGTTGADYFDYIISDPIITPKSDKDMYSESLALLPHSYQITDNTREISKNIPSRKDLGLPENAFVFASFNHTYKINKETLDAWMRILIDAPRSVLWLMKSNDAAVENILAEAAKRKIAPSRIIFAEKVPVQDHLARISQADICLDTFLCNGHTTTSDALWAGVPVLTKKGKHFASRVAASLVTHAGLLDWVVDSVEEYEKMAVSYANNPHSYKKVRESFEKSRASSHLFNTEETTRDIEKLYSMIWERYVQGKEPALLEIKDEKN